MQVAFNNAQLVRVIASRSRSDIKVTFLKKKKKKKKGRFGGHKCFTNTSCFRDLLHVKGPFYIMLQSVVTQALDYLLQSVNPFPNKPWFFRVCSTGLLKTLWEKEKLLVTSNFSFSHSVFYPFNPFPHNDDF